MIKSYKIRLYPTVEQEQKMWQHIGACRYIWNYMLALQQQRYKDGEKHLSNYDMINVMPTLKKEPDKQWLQDISSQTLNIVCTDLYIRSSRRRVFSSPMPDPLRSASSFG